jgi:hypothetical protein
LRLHTTQQQHRKLDETFIDLGRQQLKNISDPVHAHLITPRELCTAHRPPRRLRMAWVAAVAVLAVDAALLVYQRLASTVATPGTQTGVGIAGAQRTGLGI